MILHYFHAALEALSPLLNIFTRRQDAIVQWTKSLLTAVIPRFLELAIPDDLSLPPALNSTLEFVNNTAVAPTTLSNNSLQIVVHDHDRPFFHATEALWHSLSPFIPAPKSDVLMYALLVVISMLLTWVVAIGYRALRRPRRIEKASKQSHRFGIQESLEYIEIMGNDHSPYSTPLLTLDDLYPADEEFDSLKTRAEDDDGPIIEGNIPTMPTGNELEDASSDVSDIEFADRSVISLADELTSSVCSPETGSTSEGQDVLPTAAAAIAFYESSEFSPFEFVQPLDMLDQLRTPIEESDLSSSTCPANIPTLVTQDIAVEMVPAAQDRSAIPIPLTREMSTLDAPPDNGSGSVTLERIDASIAMDSERTSPASVLDKADDIFHDVEAILFPKGVLDVSTFVAEDVDLAESMVIPCNDITISQATSSIITRTLAATPDIVPSVVPAVCEAGHQTVRAPIVLVSDSLPEDKTLGSISTAPEMTKECQKVVVSESRDFNVTLVDEPATTLSSMEVLPKAESVLSEDIPVLETISPSEDVAEVLSDVAADMVLSMVSRVYDSEPAFSVHNVHEEAAIADSVPTSAPEEYRSEVLPASRSFSLDPLLETPLQTPEADEFEEINTLGANGIPNLDLQQSATFVMDEDAALDLMSQSSLMMHVLNTSLSGSFSSLAEDSFIMVPPESLVTVPTPSDEKDEESLISLLSPALSGPLESSESVMLAHDFPFISMDSTISNVLGEQLDAQDWTLVNIALNEEGKFVFGGMHLPVVESASSMSSLADTSDTPRISSCDLAGFATEEAGSLVSGSRHSHSKSDSELLRFHNVYRRSVQPVSPTQLEGPKEDEFRQLSLYQGLINHDQSFHVYNPPQEMAVAINMLKRALDTIRTPRKSRAGSAIQTRVQTLPQFQYGLSAEVFLGWLRDQQLRRTLFLKSYAEVVRGTLPPILCIDYDPPDHVEPPMPAITGPIPPVAISINRSRGGQDKREIHIDQAEIVWAKACKMDEVKATRHPNFYLERDARLDGVGTVKPCKSSTSSPSVSIASRPATPAPYEVAEQRSVRRTRSDGVLRYKNERLSNDGLAAHFDRSLQRSNSNGPRASSARPAARRSPSKEAPRRLVSRGRNRDVAKPSALETIAASPPFSPPEDMGAISTSREEPPSLESLARVLFLGAETRDFETTGSVGEYARIDDDNALLDLEDDRSESLIQTGQQKRPPSLASSARRGSSVSSSKQRVWIP